MTASAARWILDNLEGPQVKDRDRTGPLLTIGQPTQVGYYSMDSDSIFKPDFSELKYLHLPAKMDSVRFDLSIGQENAVEWCMSTNPDMDFILHWILLNKSHLARTSPQKPQFICSRKVLTNVMCTPYDAYGGWIIRATRYGGNIYLCRLPTQKEIKNDREATDKMKRMFRWGYKFEQYMTSDTPMTRPEDPSVPVNEKRGFNCMVLSSVGGTPILVSGETDALRPEFTLQQAQTTGTTEHYVELKTSKLPNNPGVQRALKNKMLKWWAQSYIFGIPSIFCGFRDDAGVVHEVTEFKTRDLPAFATGFWSTKECLQFLQDFLDKASRCIVKDDPRVVYKFEWYPGEQVTCVEMTQPDSDTYRLLPDWYIREV